MMYKTVLNPNNDIYLSYGYLMLPISLRIISKIKIGSQAFFSKKGYHVSLLSLEHFTEAEQKTILNFARKFSVKLTRVTNVYRLVTQNDKQSIIVRVRLQGLRKLFSAVNKHFAQNFVYPPTHITLFTMKDQYGIGVNTVGDYRRLTRQISPKYSLRLTKSFKLV